MSAAEINHRRNNAESAAATDFSRHQREAVDSKLYYMRDVTSPAEFEALVDEELRRANATPSISGAEKTLCRFAGKLKAKLRFTRLSG
ncbi:uncharacterized protein L3040_000189 [Drepanopeziza brunnea f. sp. 'multigermtubi']|uniref:Uncharacterized protein n=1 Tax=Marssonina brunnea f. sp. multigermtubi (strain MB_m1) TaxID=1072389 RepID=K1WP20_MARBU|nr:uncharacterized protein MBM_07387 [Drepanopeziza brunnea f. sp. 'multigermtubi' MB_m1]EKD14666.1 hypothetical protein MBM_07387 [Drepanopeziza brunnea f. sp. 'multigermtubi' MB_m1]KAJ5053899.1 hypothetical protein L3040_000189 [Drepanopeziza brunnea f. sp. 'multigermtubi']